MYFQCLNLKKEKEGKQPHFFCVVVEGRKPAARLDISGTPGVEQLRPMEREVS